MSKFILEKNIYFVIKIKTLSYIKLPVAQYPTIEPPAISVSGTYPGADANTVQNTVTQVLEQNMNEIDNLVYMSSTSDAMGNIFLTLTFEAGTDPDIAQLQVQNKLQLAMPLLPQEVQQKGIHVNKSTDSFLTVVAFIAKRLNFDYTILSANKISVSHPSALFLHLACA
ncbi:efflux RND transporter permease subunit, partial [Arsenophonus endosymbiont of Bemisia tabaci]|uniref:efflux RND transporter permease subunit n=1 Tax=Arsenophonus endosymbiont of Bemisia tabaci TaxID=536059 RepID=UPI0015F6185D